MAGNTLDLNTLHVRCVLEYAKRFLNRDPELVIAQPSCNVRMGQRINVRINSDCNRGFYGQFVRNFCDSEELRFGFQIEAPNADL